MKAKRGGIRVELELERLGGPGSEWRGIVGVAVYTGRSAGEVLDAIALVLDELEAEAITDLLKRSAGELHVVTDEEVAELERISDPRTPEQEDTTE